MDEARVQPIAFRYSLTHIAARVLAVFACAMRAPAPSVPQVSSSMLSAEERTPLKKSLADVYAVLSSQGEHEPLSLFDRQRRELHVSTFAELPINSPLFIDNSVVERISDDIVLFSDRDEERVLHLSAMGSSGPATAGASASSEAASAFGSTPQEEHDSPLLLRAADSPVLYGGEEVQLCVTDVPVRLVRGARVEAGYLLATNYRVVFIAAASLPARGEPVTARLLLQHLTRRIAASLSCFPLLFARVVRSEKMLPFHMGDDRDGRFAAAVASTMVRVSLVDGRLLSFEFSHTHLERNQGLVAALLRLLDRSVTRPFAFAFRPTNPYTFDGWSAYNFFREMRRLFQAAPAVLVLDEEDASSVPIIGAKAARMRPTEWRVADVSRLCPSYPKFVAIPRHVSDEQLAAVAAFRSLGRVPALAFLHPETGAALVRCSQPLAGIAQARCEEDEFYFCEMVRRNPSGQGLVIFDARPFLNAAWNRGIKGAGYENEATYNCKVLFLDIQNVHKVRDAHEALLTQFYPDEEDDTASAQRLEDVLPSGPSSDGNLSDGWMLTVSKLLDGALKISEHLAKGMCVAVHCLAHDQLLLTSRGFKSREEIAACWKGTELTNGLLIGTMNPATATLEFQACQRLVCNAGREDGVLIEFSSLLASGERHVYARVTPEHQMYVVVGESGTFQKMTAEEMMEHLACDAHAWFRMAHVPRGEKSVKGGEWIERLRSFGASLREQKVTCLPEWMWQLSAESLRCVLFPGDECVAEFECVSCTLASELELLAVCASLVPQVSGDGCRVRVTAWRDVIVRKEDVRRVSSRQVTWCVTVANGLIVTRRPGGVPLVVGNCSDGWDRTPQLTSCETFFCACLSF